MRRVITLAILALLVNSSCHTDLAKEPIVIQTGDHTYGLPDTWYEDIEYIPLSSKGSENYLFGAQRALLLQNHAFVLQDINTERSIFKFDRTGRLLKSLKGSSNFQKAFYSVSDFDLFGDKVVLTDTYLNEILFFNQELEFINSVSIPESEAGVQNIAFMNKNTLLIRPDLETNPPSSVLKSSWKTGLQPEQIDGFLGVKDTPAKNMRFSFYETFHHAHNSEKILYTDWFDSHIYEVGINEVTKKYHVQLEDELWVTENELLKMSTMDTEEQFDFLVKADKSGLINAVHESEKNLMFSFMRPGKRYLVFFNRKTREKETVLLDFSRNGPEGPDGSPPLKYFLGFTDTGGLVFYHLAEEFSQYAESLKTMEPKSYSTGQKKFLAAADKTDEYCNIVLSIMK
ncbi:6-bladed beta-propeller [Neolewinella aurantiaca]|nr:6-bladed beta-propeller [Neolewinella aurantiaca]